MAGATESQVDAFRLTLAEAWGPDLRRGKMAPPNSQFRAVFKQEVLLFQNLDSCPCSLAYSCIFNELLISQNLKYSLGQRQELDSRTPSKLCFSCICGWRHKISPHRYIVFTVSKTIRGLSIPKRKRKLSTGPPFNGQVVSAGLGDKKNGC